MYKRQVSWWEATAYCRWLNRDGSSGAPAGSIVRLTTESEWERAARGPHIAGEETPIWAWGRDWRDGIANTAECDLGRTTPVGIFPSAERKGGPWDLSGNVWEWCLNWFDPEAYRKRAKECVGATAEGIAKYQVYSVDDGAFIDGHGRVVRGGGWAGGARDARVSFRYGNAPALRLAGLGFRCAASPVALGLGPRP